MAHYCMHRTSPAYRQHGLPAQRAPRSVVAELEGVLLKDADTFPYFMLVAFEASGIPRFAALLLLWPLLRLLELLGLPALALRAAALVATAGVRESDVEAVARAVLPKFLLDDVDAAAWRVFGACAGQRVVVTRMPRVMVEAFARAHLRADAVVGCDLGISRRLGRATGIVSRKQSVADEVRSRFAAVDDEPDVGLGRSKMARSFMSLCKDQRWLPFADGDVFSEQGPDPLPPVIFHDGRLARRPTPHMSLVILLLLPLGALITLVRIVVGLTVPFWTAQLIAPIFGGAVTVRGRVPLSRAGVLYVCTHRTLLDPVVLASVLGHRVSAATYSISRFSEILSPIPTVRLTRDRKVDAARIQAELVKGDVIVCPEGTTCREPFLLRFSPLFAELTDRIVPVAINCRVGFFYPTTARGWKAMDPIFLFMNPWAAFEVTFLSQLPEEATCAGGKSPVDVANHVQRLLADALGFQCTNLTRRDKYRTLAGNDGLMDAKAVPAPLHAAAWLHRVKRVCQFLEHMV